MQKPVEAPPGHSLQPRLRVFAGRELVLGAGKIMLLRLIAETGSISEAARRMQVSYNHAWTLLRTINNHFREPLVSKTRGGSDGGGAALTATGSRVLRLYDEMVEQSLAATRAQWTDLRRLLRKNAATAGAPAKKPRYT